MYSLNSKCSLSRYKFCSLSSVLSKYQSALHTPQKLLSPKKYFPLPSSRYLSWSGFYSSLSFSTPVLTFQNILLDFHSYSGLPWWAIIMLTTLGIRSIFIFPLAVHQNQVIARLMNLNAELVKMVPQLNKEVNIAAKMHGWDKVSASTVFKRSMKSQYQKLVLRDNCHPFKIVLLAVFQVPIWICFSVSLRNLAINSPSVPCDFQMLQDQLKSEGTLWFTDLTTPDTFIIPIFLTFVNLGLIEIHSLRQFREPSKFQKYLLYGMRFVSLAVGGAATINPSCVSFYWLCSSTFGLAQILILMSPRFRRIFRIPFTANASLTPYKDIASNFRKRFIS